MFKYGSLAVLMALALGLSGCAPVEVAKPTPPPPPPKVIPTYYYVGAIELDLKAKPDEDSDDKTMVRLNEKVEKTETSKGGWFLVTTADGRSGWASSRYFELRPVTDLYISKWGLSLRSSPDSKSKAVCKLRKNDQVKILNPQPKNWVEVTVGRTKSKGWVEVKNLSRTLVVTRHRKRAKDKSAKEAGEEGEKAKPAPVKAVPKPSAPQAL
jgi:uncharacterized protein YgiM (DUF1202 family)